MPKKKALHEVDKDTHFGLAVTGRLQGIPRDPGAEYKRPTLAAGAVLWRGDLQDPDSIEVAMIHRPHYNDWSLAKGKVDPGESLPTTAAREILEETGYEVRLGKLLGKVTYPVLDRTKVVYYWIAEVIGGEFQVNSEVDQLRWVSIDEAMELTSYEVDRGVLEKARKRLGLPATSTVLLVRHGHAYDRNNWHGKDYLRPLDKKGRRQAEMLVPMLLPFHPEHIVSAVPERCQATAAPLADELQIDVVTSKNLGDDRFNEDPEVTIDAFMDIVNEGGTSVVVSQGDTIPAIVQELFDNSMLSIDEVPCKKASTWALFFRDGELIGADYMASPLPVK